MATNVVQDIAILSIGLAAFFYSVENEWYKLAAKWMFLTTFLLLSFTFWEASGATDEFLIYFIFVLSMYIVLLFIDALMLIPRMGKIIARMVRG
jgi:hypothetical protein